MNPDARRLSRRTLLGADIKRFLERPLDPARPIPHAAPDAPPGAPIGEPENDWLAAPPWYPRSWGGSDYTDRQPPM